MQKPATSRPCRQPLTGAYYWLPVPAAGAIFWELVACHDLERGGLAGHRALWPAVLERLAVAWDLDAARLVRDELGRYAGLPRGRVSRWGRRHYVNHGGDTPRADGIAVVRRRFHLDDGDRGARLVVALDDHERMLPGDLRAVQRALGCDLGLRRLLSTGCGQPDDGFGSLQERDGPRRSITRERPSR